MRGSLAYKIISILNFAFNSLSMFAPYSLAMGPNRPMTAAGVRSSFPETEKVTCVQLRDLASSVHRYICTVDIIEHRAADQSKWRIALEGRCETILPPRGPSHRETAAHCIGLQFVIHGAVSPQPRNRPPDVHRLP
jgi:hypothetical protein